MTHLASSDAFSGAEKARLKNSKVRKDSLRIAILYPTQSSSASHKVYTDKMSGSNATVEGLSGALGGVIALSITYPLMTVRHY